MDFLILSRAADADDSDGTDDADDNSALNELHWAYMDGFADGMTARGPTFDRAADTWTGSLHIVDLPGPDAPADFVAREPYQRAGRFRGHHVWRFTNLLGRTMWEFGRPPTEDRFFVVALGGTKPVPLVDLPEELAQGLIVYGTLHDLDDGPAGVALAVQAPSREALDALLADPRTGLTQHEIAVHDWEFGGRR